MRRLVLLGFGLALLIFVVLDLLFHWSAVWLGSENLTISSLVVGQLLLPFAPVIAAGLVAGYTGTPRGFLLAFLAGLLGSSISTLWRLQGISFAGPAAAPLWWSVASWVLGTAFATGVCGWAGERLHLKLRRQFPDDKAT